MFSRFQTLALFLLPLFPLVAYAADEDMIAPPDEQCFTTFSQFAPDTDKTIKVVVDDTEDLLFMQNEKPLPTRIFSYGSVEYVPYAITNSNGADVSIEEVERFLADNNPKTAVNFDVYKNPPYLLTLDLGEVFPAGSFRLFIDHNQSYQIRYSIAQDQSAQVQVADPNDFQFRFLTLEFYLPESASAPSDPLIVRDINFIKTAKNTYLLNPSANTDVRIYSGYQCQDKEKYRRLLAQLEKQALAERFSVDIATPIFEIEFGQNPNGDNDFDDDGVENIQDNCPFVANGDQADQDGDLVGDVCDFDAKTKNAVEQDSDLDGVGDALDNCPSVYNPRQIDSDANRTGDLCSDDDGDGIIGYRDNCIDVANPDQKDINVNGVGDACEFDKDRDGIFDSIDNCIVVANSDQLDTDKDTIGDACDNCEQYNPRQTDADNSGVGDVCEEIEEVQKQNDLDKDGILDEKDNCPDVINPDQLDTDKDTIGDACDNCRQLQNKDQADEDKNGIGDLCEDRDNDGFDGYLDNCETHHNPDQSDADNDGIGDLCEDEDRDGIAAAEDVCPQVKNPDQMDTDNDGIGDVCDEKDNRFLESNKLFVALVITILSFTFLGLSFVLFSRLPK